MHEIWAAYFQTLYPAWAIVAILVALTYGRVAEQSWRDSGGTWKRAVLEWLDIVGFVIAGCIRDLWYLVRLRPLPPEAPLEGRYSAGHLLRFFITLSFIQSGVFGVILAAVDRSQWQVWMLIIVAVSVNFAAVAGLGHLYLAWRHCPRRWRWISLLLAAGVPVVTYLRLAL